MRLRDWPPRRILAIWAVGLLIESALIGVGMLNTHRERVQDDHEFEHAFGPTGNHGAPPSPDIRRRLESTGVHFTMHGDTVADVTLSPRAKRQVESIGQVLRSVTDRLGPTLLLFFVLAAAIYVTIPVALVTLTIAWAVLRRRPDGGARAT